MSAYLVGKNGTTPMFAFFARVIALFLLAISLVTAVLDLTRSIAASRLIITPLAETWQTVSAGTLAATKTAIENINATLWDPVFVTFMALPTWVPFLVVAMLFFWIGRPRKKKLGIYVG